MKKISSIFALLLLASIIAQNQIAMATAAPNRAELRPLMREMLEDIKALQPYMVKKESFDAKINHDEILKRLKRLSVNSDKVMRYKKLDSVSYRITGEALNEHIQHTKNAFLSGNMDYARWATINIPYACASCHTQGQTPGALWDFKASELKGTPIERADFLYSTRNYDEAEKLYADIIQKFPKTNSQVHSVYDTKDAETAAKRTIVILVRVKQDLDAAKASLQVDLKNKDLPGDLKLLIKHWISEIEKLEVHASKDSKLKGEGLLKIARQRLSGKAGNFFFGVQPDLIQYIWLSGLLYEQLNTKLDRKLVPEYLYWLAVIDNGLNNEFFYSLSTAYLRDCILSYPRTRITKSCYQEYERQMTDLYTGSHGTSLPPEVKEDLKQLKAAATL